MGPTIGQLWWLALAGTALAVLGSCVREWIRCRAALAALTKVLEGAGGRERAMLLRAFGAIVLPGRYGRAAVAADEPVGADEREEP